MGLKRIKTYQDIKTKDTKFIGLNWGKQYTIDGYTGFNFITLFLAPHEISLYFGKRLLPYFFHHRRYGLNVFQAVPC